MMFPKKVSGPHKEQLKNILSRITELLKESNESDYSVFTIEQTLETLFKETERLDKRNRFHIKRISFLFLPTGPLQEISLANPWSDEFLVLADRFDTIIENYG
ncbi:MAG: hypothetical protein ACI8ZM_000511 [Crocinitomix sp.]|jgi:hypothetical protein